MFAKKAIGFYSSQGTKPVFVSAAVANATPTKVILTYDQALDAGSIPATIDFTVTDHTVSGVAIAGSIVELTLSTAFIYFDICYVTYTAGTNPIRGNVGHINADNLASTLITNNVESDGHHWWYDATDSDTITKDGSNYVSNWASKLILSRDLVQATGTNQPQWQAGGTILFDGIDNFLRTDTFTWKQPCFIYILFNQITFTDEDRILTGYTTSVYVEQETSVGSGGLRFIAGGTAIYDILTVREWGIVRLLANGANSKIIVNDGDGMSGNIGGNNMSGLTIGGAGGSSNASNIEVQDIICSDTADSEADETAIYNWLVTRIPT